MKNTADRFVAILDVGHGNACVIKDEGIVTIVDTGLGTALMEFLREKAISDISLVLISHSDADHISGLVALIASKEFRIDRVRMNTDSAKESDLWNNLVHELETLDKMGEVDWVVQLAANSKENYSSKNYQLEILTPGKALIAKGPGSTTEAGHHITSNTASAVVVLKSAGQEIAVLAGDIDYAGLVDMHRHLNGRVIKTHVLVYPHHGGHCGANPERFATLMSQAFIPESIIFSIGRGKHDTPRPEVIDAVREVFGKVRISCTQLSEHCATHLPTSDPNHLLPLYSDGRLDRKCCAGTMLIQVNRGVAVIPNDNQYQEFKNEHAKKALCNR